MAKLIDVPGMGHVEFPDTMSDDQIVQAIQRNQSVDAKSFVQAQANTLPGMLAMGDRPELTFPQYAGQALKEIPIPMATTAAGFATGGLPGAVAGAGLGAIVNQGYGVHGKSVFPEVNRADFPDWGRAGKEALATAIIPGLAKGAGTVRTVAKKISEATQARPFVESILRKNAGTYGDELAAELRKPLPLPNYPATAAERVAGIPAGSPIQAIEQVIAKTPEGGISTQFGDRILAQREAILNARKLRADEVGPQLDDAIERANFGQQIPLLEAMAKQRIATSQRFAPPRPSPPVQNGMLRSAVELHAPYAPPVLETAAEKAGKVAASELSGNAQADAQALLAMRDIIKQQGFKPLNVQGVVRSIDNQLTDPKVGSITVAEKVLGKVKERLLELSDKSGMIAGEALQNVRRQELGNFIRTAMKEAGTWDKKQTAGVADSIQGAIDRAIENAGGTGWSKAMSEWSKRSEAIDKTVKAFTQRYKPEQRTEVAGVRNMAEASGRHLLPNWLSRPVTGIKWLQDLLAARLEPKIDRELANLFLGQQTPQGVSHEALAKIVGSQPPSRYDLMMQEILKRQAPLAAGIAAQ